MSCCCCCVPAQIPANAVAFSTIAEGQLFRDRFIYEKTSTAPALNAVIVDGRKYGHDTPPGFIGKRVSFNNETMVVRISHS